jgi:hypothetical protein
MAQSEDAPEASGGSEAKPSFQLFETKGGGMIRGSDGDGGTTEIYLSPTDVNHRVREHPDCR